MAIPPFGSAPLPAQNGNSGKFLTTNGSSSSWGTPSGSGKPSFSFIVASSGGDYTDIQSALDALPSTGGDIYVRDATYTISSTLLVKTSQTRIIISDGAIVQCNGASVTPLIKPNANTLTLIEVIGGKWLQTNATAQGVAFDFSDSANHHIAPMRIENFGTAINLVDTANKTFYSTYRDIQIFDCNNGINIGGNPANNNSFYSLRIRPKASGAGTGIKIVGARGLTFVGIDIETSHGDGHNRRRH